MGGNNLDFIKAFDTPSDNILIFKCIGYKKQGFGSGDGYRGGSSEVVL